MIYLKSVFAGVVAIAVSFFVFFIGVGIYLWIAARKLNPQGAGAIAWDPISITSPGFLLGILAIFVAGFLWEFRRASR